MSVGEEEAFDCVSKLMTGLVWDERFELHDTPSYHPETPARSRHIVAALQEEGVLDRCDRIPLREVTDEELRTTHTRAHILKVDNSSGTKGQFDGDTHHSADSSQIARLAAGSLIDITEKVYLGELTNGFAVVRPPGHHATEGRIMGFCLYNNVAVAVNSLKKKHGIDRVMIVDWDVHHGNGTQAIFLNDPSVLYFSIHKYTGSFYPGTGGPREVGLGKAKGKTINVPVPCNGLGDDVFIAAFDKVLVPVCKDFKPQLIVVSCGFDAAHGDPLGELTVTPYGYAQLTNMLMRINPKIVLALEGGYNLTSISNSAVACCKTLLGDEVLASDYPLPSLSSREQRALPKKLRRFDRLLETVIEIHQQYWPSLHDELKDDMTGIAHQLKMMSIRDENEEDDERTPDTPYVTKGTDTMPCSGREEKEEEEQEQEGGDSIRRSKPESETPQSQHSKKEVDSKDTPPK